MFADKKPVKLHWRAYDNCFECYIKRNGRSYSLVRVKKCRPDVQKKNDLKIYYFDPVVSSSADFDCNPIRGLKQAKEHALKMAEQILADLDGIIIY